MHGACSLFVAPGVSGLYYRYNAVLPKVTSLSHAEVDAARAVHQHANSRNGINGSMESRRKASEISPM